MTEIPVTEWDAFISAHPEAHLLQTSAWGALKSEFGWDVAHVLSEHGMDNRKIGAQVLFRSLPLGMSVAYIPKGPVGARPDDHWSRWEAFWPYVDTLSRRYKAVFLKVEPDLWEDQRGDVDPVADISPSGFR